MKKYTLCILLVILLIAKIFRADENEIPEETPAEKEAKHHHCYQKNYTTCIAKFSEGVGSVMKKYRDQKLKSIEVLEKLKPELKPVQEDAYKCLNKTKAKMNKCPVGLDRCVIATFIFTDNTTLITAGCETDTPTICFTLLKLDDYEYYTGKKARTIKCDFCNPPDCNKIEE